MAMDPIDTEVAQGILEDIQRELTKRGYTCKQTNNGCASVPMLWVAINDKDLKNYVYTQAIFGGCAANIPCSAGRDYVSYCDPNYINLIVSSIIDTLCRGRGRSQSKGTHRGR